MCDYPVSVMMAVFAGGLTAILLGMCIEPRAVWHWRRRLARAWKKFWDAARTRVNGMKNKD